MPDSVRTGGGLQNFPYIAGYVGQVREEARRTHTPVLLVDLGDSLTGSFASAITHGANVVTFFNELQYDAVMLGNLDADLAPETVKSLQMPVLCPFETSEGAPAMAGTQFATIVKKEGLEVELLANFYGDTRQEEFPERFPTSFGASEAVMPLRDYARVVQTLPPPSAQVLRLFQWMKFEHEGSEAPALLENLRQLKVDAVLAHRVYGREKTDAWVSSSTYAWNPPVSLNILRNNKGFALARADLKRVAGKWTLQRQQILPMMSNTAPADEGIARKVRRFGDEITKANKVVAHVENSVSPEGILQRYLAALASLPGANVALYSQQSIRAGWPKGDLRVGDIYASLPWAKGLVQFELSANQLTELNASQLFTIYVAPNLPADGSRTITTSDFLGRVVAKRLNLDRARFRTVVDKPEYVFFSEYLQRMADPSQNLNQPAGWALHTAATPL